MGLVRWHILIQWGPKMLVVKKYCSWGFTILWNEVDMHCKHSHVLLLRPTSIVIASTRSCAINIDKSFFNRIIAAIGRINGLKTYTYAVQVLLSYIWYYWAALTHWPFGDLNEILDKWFQDDILNRWLGYLLWNCRQVIVIGHSW